MKMPCGRTTKVRELYCRRKHHCWNTYWIKYHWGAWVLRCLFCHDVLYVRPEKMTLKEYIFKTQTLREKGE